MASALTAAEQWSARTKQAWLDASARHRDAKSQLDVAYADYLDALRREVIARGGTLVVLCDPYEAASRREGK